MSIRPLLRVLVVAAALVGVMAPTVAHAKPIPEADSDAKPGDHAGYFLGYPSQTLAWHGCQKYSTQDTPTSLDTGVPGVGPGNKQNKVTWTVETSTTATSKYVVKWKVADGWKICGAQVTMLGRDPAVAFDLALQAGYTSKGTRGSTVTSGSETIMVKLTKKDCQELGIDEQYAGRYSIAKIYAIAVYIKKDKKK